MVSIIAKDVLRRLLTFICVVLCLTASASPVHECGLYKDTYICTGAQYQLYCNTSAHDFEYISDPLYAQHYTYHLCYHDDCLCFGDNDTCTCTSNTSSCFCSNNNTSITISPAVSPRYDCLLYSNNTYICTGVHYRMYCSPGLLYYTQYQHVCYDYDCRCYGDKYNCRCYGNISSNCFCENYNNNISTVAIVSAVNDCEFSNDTYICTGAQYRMYCDINQHDFYYTTDYHYCTGGNCHCYSDKYNCKCYGNISSNCFCDINSVVSLVNDCKLYKDTYICTGAQYQLYCNTSVNDFWFLNYETYSLYQGTEYFTYHWCYYDGCDCFGDNDTCTCTSNTSSCFCSNNNTSITISPAVSPRYDCLHYSNNTYICTGVHYRMYCSPGLLYYTQYQHVCYDYDCRCYGDKYTCRCYGTTSPYCSCESIPVHECGLYKDTYICTGAQYQLYCNTSAHDFEYFTHPVYQDAQHHTYHWCYHDGCLCLGNMDTCTCYSSTSSCFCSNDNTSITISPAVSPRYDCLLYSNNTYICTGVHYRMYCSAWVLYYTQYQHVCRDNDCRCYGDKYNCRCYGNISSNCFCENYNNNISTVAIVSAVNDCEFSNDTYICTGAQYRMYCDINQHDFYYTTDYHYCIGGNCHCYSDKYNCKCYGNISSECFCENDNSNISPVHECGLYKDTYICTGAQYQLYCNTSVNDFWYLNYETYSLYQGTEYFTYHSCYYDGCDCFGDNDTCASYSNTSSCFCSNNNTSITISPAVSPRYDCLLYSNNTYICTGVHYRMYCSPGLLYYTQYQHVCYDYDCRCYGDKYNCRCYGTTSMYCSCENYYSNINTVAIVSAVNDCELFTDTYICTGAHYRMYCDISQHDFDYTTHNHYCIGGNCHCYGDKYNCNCYESANSTCFCSTASSFTLPDECMNQTTGCLKNLLDQIENITVQDFQYSTKDVANLLEMVFNTSEMKLSSFAADRNKLVSDANLGLKACEMLISMLVRPTDTSDSVTFSLDTVEAQVFMVGPDVTLDEIPRLDTTNASMDIDLIEIAKNSNEKSAAVAFMSYNTIENLLKPDFFNTSDDRVKTMMSTVISATLPKTTNKQLTKPVNFTLKHIREFVSGDSLSCVYWNITEWIVDGCSVIHTNSNYTVCSCLHLSTFAVIKQTSSSRQKDHQLIYLYLALVIVGLVFLGLALLAFAACRRKHTVNNAETTSTMNLQLFDHLDKNSKEVSF